MSERIRRDAWTEVLMAGVFLYVSAAIVAIFFPPVGPWVSVAIMGSVVAVCIVMSILLPAARAARAPFERVHEDRLDISWQLQSLPVGPAGPTGGTGASIGPAGPTGGTSSSPASSTSSNPSKKGAPK